ncbi:MAG: ATP-binding cassette domain-containing protein, partial [Erysipelotrichaceae bacterium]
FLLVSHDREVLDQVCNHIIALNRHCIDVVSGNFSSWYAGKLERDAFEQHQNHSLKKHIHKMEASAKQKATWSDRLEATKIGSHVADRGFVGAQAARMMKRSKQIERRRNQAIAQQKGLLKEVDHIEPLTLTPRKHHKKRLLALEDVVVMRTKALHQPISFELLEHERILLRGANGAGKTSVMEAIQGKLAYSGTIALANGVILAYLPQTTAHLEGNLIAYLKQYTNDVTGCLTRLKKLDFERSDFDVDLATLSEGQKKKVAIAIALGEQAHLYVWDEPMNYLDVITRMQVEEAILQSRATMVFVSHDTTTQAKLATKEVTLVLP